MAIPMQSVGPVRVWAIAVAVFGLCLSGCGASLASSDSSADNAGIPTAIPAPSWHDTGGGPPVVTPTTAISVDESKCWVPGLAVTGCADLISVSGRTPAGISDDTLTNAVLVRAHGAEPDGRLSVYMELDKCPTLSINARISGDVWYPEDVTYPAILCGPLAGSPGVTPTEPTNSHEWVTGLMSNPFKAAVLGDTIRFTSVSDASSIDFHWAN